MLDTDTKRRIDTARDILVGKVPDPKSQVEQITIALIYKFMDDMDAESEELGGKRKFFTGDFARYGWVKLLRSGLSGHETLALYAEGMTRMTENPGLPELFRDIFKNAYLPYRDPETLKAFLKIIDEFTYDHSEKLGDAFEYLLSVLGSQGDAGQFRTPRHIIDFMVEVVDPKKNEKILDPACGTAGFLVSAYKYIKLQNSSEAQRKQAEAKKAQKTAEERIHTSSLNGASGDLLTPDDRAALARNIRGYDISPDMVRLSLVNLYLHGFSDPHIYEYDSLTSEERWNEFADVILANPPFMSPKGGIKPHQRFSIQSKRSEVLFVDYMAEHLTPAGRAGIIVPEGIIFQSQTAYRDLRKKLIDECLVAVVSLPAGCFNPYSGVKTSILILDKALAKHSDTVAFFKVENDGFGLGAQRRPINKNDLPEVKRELRGYLDTLRKLTSTDALELRHGLVVEKTRILEGGECNLSGERYREVIASSSIHDLVKLGDVCDLIGGSTPSKKNVSYWSNGTIKWISSKHINDSGSITDWDLISEQALEETSTRLAPTESTIIITRVSVGKFAYADSDYAINQDLTALITKNSETLLPQYVFRIAPFIAKVVERNAEGIGVRGVTRSFLSNLEIPLPPLPVQQEIVVEIEGYQKVIDGARAVLDHYRPHIPIHPDWPLVELGEVCESFQYGSSKKSSIQGQVVCLRMGNIQKGEIDWSDLKFAPDDEDFERYKLQPDDVLFNRTNSPVHVGKTGIYRGGPKAVFAGYLIRINYNRNKLVGAYLNYCLNTDGAKKFCQAVKTDGINQSNINAKSLSMFPIPLPPLETQQAIVAEIEAEQALVNANRELMARMEKKIEATLARVWGENEQPAGATQ